MTTCKICGGIAEKCSSMLILGKYNINYFHCSSCDFIQTEDPYWLKEAYDDPINKTDTGYVTRNVFLSKKVLILFLLLFGKNKSFLDYASGYGLLPRLMRDYGLDFYWDDLYTKNIFCQGFSINDFLLKKVSAVTCFECFEHFSNPLEEINKILKFSDTIFFSTRLFRDNKIPDSNWEYYGLEHGQHISFYSKKTLKYIAEKFKLNYYTNGDNLHLFTRKKVKYIFKLSMFLSKIQMDIFIRKLLISKIVSDSNSMK